MRTDYLRLSIKLQFFQLTMHRDTYIYAHCSKCQAKLKYKKDVDSGMFKLFFINKVHEHPLKKEENRIVESYIRELPETMPISSMMAMTKKNFSISRSKFYYLHRRVWNEKFSFKEMVATLDEKRYESRFNPFPLEEKEIPNLFITVSPKMIKNFKVKIKLLRNLDSLSPSM